MNDMGLKLTTLVDIKKEERPWLVIGFIALLTTFGLLLGWAAIAPLQSAVVAPGRVSVASQNKIVQHLDGGLVANIAVKDGDLVEAGTLILSLHRGPLEIELERVRGQKLEVQANLERLKAEREAAKILVFSDDLQQQIVSGLDRDMLSTQQLLFTFRRQSFNAEQDVLQQRLEQTAKQIEGSKVLLETLRHRLLLLIEDVTAAQTLTSRKLASIAQLRERLGLKVELEGTVAKQEIDISRLHEARSETRHQIYLKVVQYKKEVITNQRDLQAQNIRLMAEEKILKDKLSRIDIRAPVSGKIKGFEVVTQGAVIGAGKPIMEIVPLEQAFRISARISPMDIDAIYPGLKAEVRLPVFDGSQQFPPLWALLEDVSTDTYLGNDSEDAYYKAHLVLSAKSIKTLSQLELELLSGMPAELYINTGERTLIDYLMKPIKLMLSRAFNEV